MTNTEMIERVARAFEPTIWEIPHFLADGSAIQKRYIDDRQKRSLEKARAAIQAMREPTEAMLEAGHEVVAGFYTRGYDCPAFEDSWRAAIDAILKEHP